MAGETMKSESAAAGLTHPGKGTAQHSCLLEALPVQAEGEAMLLHNQLTS